MLYLKTGVDTVQFCLRPWRETDAESITKYANNRKVAQNLRDVFPFPYTLEDARRYAADCVKSDGNGKLVRAIEVGGEAVGSISIFVEQDVYRKSAEIGYWLGEPFWGRGIMSQAVKQLCEEAWERFDIVRIFAEPFARNLGSRRVLEHAGFQLEGIKRSSVYKNGELLDSCIYALVKE